MTFAALMVDVDGVIVTHPPGRRWDADLEADLGIDPASLQSAFFTPHWAKIAIGNAKLEELLSPALATIAPTVTAETLIAYWFAKDTQLDQTLLGALARLRANGMPMHLATVQEDRRAAYLWQTLGLKDRFDSILHSGLIGAAKPDSAYFDAVAQRLNLAPGDLMLLDDRQDNVDAAIGSGWQARLWTGRQTLDEVLFTSV